MYCANTKLSLSLSLLNHKDTFKQTFKTYLLFYLALSCLMYPALFFFLEKFKNNSTSDSSPKYFHSLPRYRSADIGTEILSQASVSDLFKKKRKTCWSSHNFPVKAQSHHSQTQMKQKGLLLQHRKRSWWCVTSRTIDSICCYGFQTGWGNPQSPLFGTQKK